MSFFLRFNWYIYIYTYFQKFDRNSSSSRTSYNIFFNILSLMGCKSVFSSSVFLSFMRSSLNGTRFRFGIQSSRAFFHLLMFSTFVFREIEAVWKCSAVMRPEKFPRLGCFANCTSLLYTVFVHSYRLYRFSAFIVLPLHSLFSYLIL